MSDSIVSQFGYKIIDNAKSTLTEAYNVIGSSLIDPITFSDLSGYDDGSRSFRLQKGWSGLFEYTAEGMVGLSLDSITTKYSSTVSFGRMYYANGEPDYMVVVKFLNNDQFFKKIDIMYDETTIVGIMTCYPRGYDMEYSFLFSFKKINGVVGVDKLYFAVNKTFIFNPSMKFVYGIKEYDRPERDYVLYEIAENGDVYLLNTNYADIKQHVIATHVIFPAYTQSNVASKGTIKATRNAVNLKYSYRINSDSKFGFKKYTVSINDSYGRDSRTSDVNKMFDYQLFIEGQTKRENLYIESTNRQSSKIFANSINDELIVKDLMWGEYNISAGKYRKTINNHTPPMIKGSLSGLINVLGCEGENNNFIIKCFRSYDDFFIGEYPITDSKYSIHNLDVNTKYNLVLVDLNKNLESKMLSDRHPTPYDGSEVVLYKPSNVHYSYVGTGIMIRWNFIGDYEKFIVYRSTSIIKRNSLPEPLVETKHHLHLDNSVEKGVTYYYMIGVVVGEGDVRYSTNMTLTSQTY